MEMAWRKLLLTSIMLELVRRESHLVDERPSMLLGDGSRKGAEQCGEADHPSALIRFKIIIGKMPKALDR